MGNFRKSEGIDWDVWVTNILAFIFVIVGLGVVLYTTVAVEDLDKAKLLIGFSSYTLGVILGYYFNRERLIKVGKEKDTVSTRRAELGGEFDKIYLDHLELAQRYKALEDLITEIQDEISAEGEE